MTCRNLKVVLFGFTTIVVANEGLESDTILNQVPQDQQVYIPSEGCGENFSSFSRVAIELSRLQGKERKENCQDLNS